MKSIIKFLIFITIICYTFQPVSSECINLQISSGSKRCFDIVTLNTTYIDKTGNLRHGNVNLISTTTSDALSNTIQNTIMMISFIYAMVYFNIFFY
jgi:hypothetical protein